MSHIYISGMPSGHGITNSNPYGNSHNMNPFNYYGTMEHNTVYLQATTRYKVLPGTTTGVLVSSGISPITHARTTFDPVTGQMSMTTYSMPNGGVKEYCANHCPGCRWKSNKSSCMQTHTYDWRSCPDCVDERNARIKQNALQSTNISNYTHNNCNPCCNGTNTQHVPTYNQRNTSSVRYDEKEDNYYDETICSNTKSKFCFSHCPCDGKVSCKEHCEQKYCAQCLKSRI